MKLIQITSVLASIASINASVVTYADVGLVDADFNLDTYAIAPVVSVVPALNTDELVDSDSTILPVSTVTTYSTLVPVYAIASKASVSIILPTPISSKTCSAGIVTTVKVSPTCTKSSSATLTTSGIASATKSGNLIGTESAQAAQGSQSSSGIVLVRMSVVSFALIALGLVVV